MIYILLFVWHTNYGHGAVTTGSAEFNSKEACQIAADELQRQAKDFGKGQVPMLLCTPKG